MLREGRYEGPGQVELSIRDTKRFIFFFENRGVSVHCGRSEFFIDYTGLGGRGELVVLGNGGSVADCSDSAIRSQRKTSISSVRFLRNRALRFGSAVRVAAFDPLTDLVVESCVFEDQLQRPIEAPSNLNHEGGGALWAMGVSEVRLIDSNFSGNEASQGGGMFLVDCVSVFIKSCFFERNWALLDSVGGGGAAIVMTPASNGDAEATLGTVTIVDCGFRGNQAGGAAAGLYVGGLVKLNLTRVVFSNNTSLATSISTSPSLKMAGGGGVGLLVYGSVTATAVNVSAEANRVLSEAAPVARNVACSGAILRNNCVLLWNHMCDLCLRKLLGYELALRSQPCENSSQFVWRLETIIFLAAGVCLFLLVGGGVFLTVVLVRRRRQHQRGLHEPDVNLLADEIVEMTPKKNALGLTTTTTGVGAGNSERQNQQVQDFDDEAEFDELEPPGYGARTPSMIVTAASPDSGTNPRRMSRQWNSTSANSSEELLPSHDFALRVSPSSTVNSFKEIAYEELELDPEPIGSGAFGLVYRAMWRGSVVAVKKFIGSLDAQGVSSFRAEAQLLHAIGNHPNVIKLFGACTVGPHHCLVVPYYQRGSVRDYLQTLPKAQRTWSLVASIAIQIAAGMMHLHKENIVHRDLAARNVLIDNNDEVRISDFGLARFVLHASSGRTNSNVGAVAWMSPEAVAKRSYSKKSDVWSFGCTLWELCTGELPFAGVEPIHVAVLVASGKTPQIPDDVSRSLASVMRACWAAEPAERPSFDDLYDMLRNISQQL